MQSDGRLLEMLNDKVLASNQCGQALRVIYQRLDVASKYRIVED